ncbi:MAG TPA: hypothetical protein VFA70_03035 [Dehalococcoidia bacterium]|nr:hypothetical protein [Dehalococcoidia bacterium]
MQINFTGEDPLQGSFTDPQTGSGYSSCTQYATDTNTGHGWMGPGSVTQPPTQVEGKTVTLVMGVAEGAYHGPGTYANALTGVIVGSDDFYTGNTSVTVHGDGSGTATFSNLSGLANGTESGTITWTCA